MSEAETAVLELPEQLTIILPKPITFDNREIREIQLYEPLAGHVLYAEQQLKNGANAWAIRNRQIHLIAKCGNVPIPVVEKMPMRQFNAAWNFIVPFFDATPAITAS